MTEKTFLIKMSDNMLCDCVSEFKSQRECWETAEYFLSVWKMRNHGFYC